MQGNNSAFYFTRKYLIMEKEKVSIVIPAFNVEKWISRCLDSVINQTYKNLEIIVVDDCSTDDTAEIIDEYKKIDQRIIYTKNKENRGLFAARLIGSKLASGDFIAFLDSDDYVSLDYYQCLVESCLRNDSDIAICDSTVIVQTNGDKYIRPLHRDCFDFDVIEGREIQDRFWELGGQCFSWHTVWNKIYRKDLFDKCSVFYKNIDKHLIMTEDIAYSIPMFFFANKVSVTRNTYHYYCQNEQASTNTQSMALKKFRKSVDDIASVFEFIDNFLVVNGADQIIKNNFAEMKKYYYRMWNAKGHEIFVGKERENVVLSLEKLVPGYHEKIKKEDCSMDAIYSKFDDRYEKIKELIINSKKKYVSFDIFDTLLLRPFYNPDDLFILMDKRFEKLYPGCISFSKIRKDGEAMARFNLYKTRPGFEDVNLDEIYKSIQETYGISDEILAEMKDLERSLEVQFCQPRKAAKHIFNLAKHEGKRVILTSDMYLDIETIEKMLEKCGYVGYDKLFLSSDRRLCKFTGNLFKEVIKELDAKDEIIHIGDNWVSDVTLSEKNGIQPVFFPKGKELMENQISGIVTNNCGKVAEETIGFGDRSKLYESIGYRTMISLVSNKFFDNPYRDFNPETDLDADPSMIGYYCVGMHLVGLVDWLKERSKGYDKICFLSRDGKLVMEAFEILKKYYPNMPETKYVMSSRKCLLPWIVSDTLELYNLPIEIRNHSPKSVLKMISFCSKEVDDTKLSDAGFETGKLFTTREEFVLFIKFFINNFYDEEKHIEAKAKTTKYYEQMIGTDKTLVFDFGYSGRVPYAMSKALGKNIDVVFAYSSTTELAKYQRTSAFDLECMYPFEAAMSGAIREHLISDTGPSCTGFEYSDGIVVPTFGKTDRNRIELFTLNTIQRNAIQFVEEWYSLFNGYLDYLPFKDYEVSLPFESFVRFPKQEDIRVFSSSVFEDSVYGGKDDISFFEMWKGNAEYMGYKHGTLVVSDPTTAWARNIYPDGLYVKFYHFLESLFPLGSKKRTLIKSIVSFVIKPFEKKKK